MFRTLLLPLLSATALGALAAPARADEAAVKAAVAKAYPLLLKGAEGHTAQRECFACHNQALPVLALMTARERGFRVDEEALKKQMRFIATFLDKNRENYRQGKGQGGQVDTAGYALFTLELGGWRADATTEAVVDYLLLRGKDTDRWRATSNRPPSEASDFTTTYLALRGLLKWGTPAQQDRVTQRVEAIRGWLFKTPAKDTEERVFRLLALKAVGAGDQDLRAAVENLQTTQQPDGGWRQIDSLESDAYATGSALVALHQAGGVAPTDAAYRRGVAYLMKTQHADGSWYVRSRSKPFQTYFETGFPHGKDQFISSAASGWAATALALTLPRAGDLPVIESGLKPIRVALVGDSTVASYPKPPADRPDLTGWGQVLGELFNGKVEVRNHAVSGRSSKSFLREKRWQPVLDAKPDYVLIQFGHNDQPGKGDRTTDPEKDFPENLRTYVREARAVGAVPILVTPVARRIFKDGKPVTSLTPYADAMKQVGREIKTPVLDLHAASLELLTELGEAGSADHAPDAKDRTHFSRKGALAMAKLVSEAVKRDAPALSKYLKP